MQAGEERHPAAISHRHPGRRLIEETGDVHSPGKACAAIAAWGERRTFEVWAVVAVVDDVGHGRILDQGPPAPGGARPPLGTILGRVDGRHIAAYVRDTPGVNR